MAITSSSEKQIETLEEYVTKLDYSRAILFMDDVEVTMRELIEQCKSSAHAQSLLVDFISKLEGLFMDLADIVLKETSQKRLTAHYQQKLSKAAEMLRYAKNEEDADLAITEINQAKSWLTSEKEVKSKTISDENGPVTLFWKLWIVIDDGVGSNSLPSEAYETFSASLYGIIATALKDPMTFQASEESLKKIYHS